MMRNILIYGVVCWLMAMSLSVNAQIEFTAVLAGHVVIPADTLIAAPKDAPANLERSGKFTTGKRLQQNARVEGMSSDRPTGIYLPFKGQPIQGHSGIKKMADETFWILTDNGAGSKANSPDFMLYLNRYKIDFKKNQFTQLDTIFLHDPDQRVPFHIVTEGTQRRYLTGSDFDIESFQFAGGYLWIGEEFGPYLIKADMTGRVLSVIDTLVDGKVVRSPDNPFISTPNIPSDRVKFEVRRSKGFEGMAASKDGSILYPLLEGALWDEHSHTYEAIDGKQYLRILEFDVITDTWTGRHWKYVLEANHHAIGDFNMIDDTTGLVIERDNGEGVSSYKCSEEKKPNCFHDLPKFKRIYKIEMTNSNVNGPVRKIGYVDLLNIQDTYRVAHKPLDKGVFTFPFLTTENVDIVDDRHIVVGNDNNLPFSSSRDPNKADDNELIVLDVGNFLTAR